MIILRQKEFSKNSEKLYENWKKTGDDKDAYEFMNVWTEEEYKPARKKGIFVDPDPEVVRAAERYVNSNQKNFSQRQEIDKNRERVYQDMKKKYPGLYRNRDFVSQYKTLSPEDQKYISNRDADDFTDYIFRQVDKRRSIRETNEREIKNGNLKK